MPARILPARLLSLLFFGLFSLAAAPIIHVQAITWIDEEQTSSTYAYARATAMQNEDWFDDWEDNYVINYEAEAWGYPTSVAASVSASVEGSLAKLQDPLSVSALAEAAGQVKIIGGSGPALVDFLLDFSGADYCAEFFIPGVDAGACAWRPTLRWTAVPFRFNQPFDYSLYAAADLSFPDEESDFAFVDWKGIRVKDLAGREVSGARLVPGDFQSPSAPIPEPSALLLTAAGFAALALRRRFARSPRI